jgi:hypothetical protein
VIDERAHVIGLDRRGECAGPDDLAPAGRKGEDFEARLIENRGVTLNKRLVLALYRSSELGNIKKPAFFFHKKSGDSGWSTRTSANGSNKTLARLTG